MTEEARGGRPEPQGGRGRGGAPGRGRGGTRGGGRKTRAAFGAKLSTSDGDRDTPGSASVDRPAPATSAGNPVTAPTDAQPALEPLAGPSTSSANGTNGTSAEVDAEEELCFICAEPVKYYALGPCSHRTCHVCAIRLRALYKKNRCTFCQTECSSVIFTSDPERPFEAFPPSSLPYTDSKLAISCETREQLDALLSLLRFNCPHSSCDSVLSGWADLKRHTRAAHGLVMCDLCTRNKKIFAHEHTLFTPAGLGIHMREGEVGAGKGEEGGGTGKEGGEGFRGHPRCDFCGIHFHDADELYAHCRDKHEQCFICTRNGVGRWQYYLDYNALEGHFRQAHNLCPSSTCLQQRFVVFEHPFELQSHQVEVHGAELGKGAMQAARRIETNFTYNGDEAGGSAHGTAASDGARGDRGGSRGGRGGAAGMMNIAPVGAMASANTTNADRRVPGLGPTRPDRPGFGANLTTESTSAPQTTRSGLDSEHELHAALTQRVREAVHGSEAKMTAFRSAVRSYRSSEMSASDLVDTLWAIFESVDAANDIIPAVAGLFESHDKRQEVLRAWDAILSQRNAFPSLNGTPTASSRRNSRQAVWARVEAAANSRPLPAPARDRFPNLSKAPNRMQVPGLMPRASTASGAPRTAWSAAASGGSSAASSARASPVPPLSQPSSNATPRYTAFPSLRTSEASFPSLPTNATAIDRQARVREALAKGPRRVDAPSPPGPGQWGPPPGANIDAITSQLSEVDVGASERRAGKKPKKVLLYSNSVR